MTREHKGGYATCQTCNKVLYESRKDARYHARKRYPGAKGLNAYYCTFSDGWHLGNLPPGGRDQARRIMKGKSKSKDDGASG